MLNFNHIGPETQRQSITWTVKRLLLLMLISAYVLAFDFTLLAYASGNGDECKDWKLRHPEWIWCDDFEDAVMLKSKYYDLDDNNGDLSRVNSQSAHGIYSLRARWQKGEVDAGHFMRTFGRNPVNSQSHSSQNFTEIYWRHYFKLQNNFVGLPDKLSRVFIFAQQNWAQAMIAHLWLDESGRQKLMLDPASGINNNNNLVTRGWNDFDNLKWLGAKKGSVTIASNKWYCIEGHVKLNSPGAQNGIFEFWLDDKLEARSDNINWTGSWGEYGLNTVFFSNHWNNGSPTEQERYFDALVISKSRIGCIDTTPPAPPGGFGMMGISYLSNTD